MDTEELGGEAVTDEELIAEIEAEEAEKEPEPSEGDEEDKGRVPSFRLREESERRRKAEERAERMERLFAQGQERYNEILSQTQKPKEEEDALPEWDDDDPLGSIRARDEWQARQIMGFKKEGAEERQRAEQQEQANRLNNYLMQDYQTVKSERTDIDAAFDHVRQARTAHFEAIGADPVYARQSAEQELNSVANFALQRGMSPARAVYEYATKLGYAVKTEGKEKIESVSKGQKAARPGGGSRGGSNMTPEQLLDLPETEFMRLWPQVMGDEAA